MPQSHHRVRRNTGPVPACARSSGKSAILRGCKPWIAKGTRTPFAAKQGRSLAKVFGARYLEPDRRVSKHSQVEGQSIHPRASAPTPPSLCVLRYA
eukprot:scaffold1201_cov413-Prasinococcus_capsulatus_cf.AAC.11